jgi:uncharacterized membrane protein YqgA involved in biofilm formation
MLGTLFNTASVAIGSSIGLLFRRHITPANQSQILSIFGIFTIALSIDMMSKMVNPIDIFIALIIGSVIGQTLSLHSRLTTFSEKLNLGSGFIKATVLFCVGGLTIIGCMEEGLSSNYRLLYIKGVMDLISSVFLAAALGKGVLFSALGVLIFQGTLTFMFFSIGSNIPEVLILDLTAAGGILLLALGLDLSDIKKFKILDLLPTLVILPIINLLHGLLILSINGFGI